MLVLLAAGRVDALGTELLVETVNGLPLATDAQTTRTLLRATIAEDAVEHDLDVHRLGHAHLAA